MQNVTLTPGIFIDRDGVINANRSDHVKRWEEFIFLPGALDALRTLADRPAPIIVITNQALIGRGIVPAAIVEDVHARMRAVVAAAGGRIDDVYLCPHRPEDGCDCRKPQPGLLRDIGKRYAIDLKHVPMVGDTLRDLQAAAAAGCEPHLVLSGRAAGLDSDAVQALADQVPGTRVHDDLPAFAEHLLGRGTASP